MANEDEPEPKTNTESDREVVSVLPEQVCVRQETAG